MSAMSVQRPGFIVHIWFYRPYFTRANPESKHFRKFSLNFMKYNHG